MSNQNISEFVRENKIILTVIMIIVVLIELEIFALAAMKSGRKSWLQITDNNGKLIHETDGDNLSKFNRYYFERTFGPIEEYQMKLAREDKPFPFRAWFTATLGVPLGAVLLFGFVFKSYLFLFRKEEISDHKDKFEFPSFEENNKIDFFLSRISRLNVFVLGGFVFAVVISYWIIPDTINYIGKIGIDTLARFKWFSITLMVLLTLLFMWFIYLKYRLAKSSIESRVKIQKYKLQLKYYSNEHLSQLETDTVKIRNNKYS